jgi:hypothetical protein
MTHTNRIIKFTLLILITIILADCVSENTSMPHPSVLYPPTLDPVTPPMGLPSFIREVWPQPGSINILEGYDWNLENYSVFKYYGVGFEIVSDEIEQTPDRYFDSANFRERILLFLNGQEISKDDLKETEEIMLDCTEDGVEYECGSIRTYWKIRLEPGYYIARLVYESKSGEIFEFSWSFTMVDWETYSAN